MFSNLLVSLVVGFGGGGWIFMKVLRSSGNNSKNAAIVGSLAGFVIFLVILMIMNALFKG